MTGGVLREARAAAIVRPQPVTGSGTASPVSAMGYQVSLVLLTDIMLFVPERKPLYGP